MPPSAPPEPRATGPARDVELRVRATPDALATVRTVAGDLAARAEFPLDAVDDLRLAVDEACTCLAALARPDTTMTATFTLTDGRMTMTASVSTAGPTTLPRDTFGWRVLTTLADDVAVLAETPAATGEPHRLALRMTMDRAVRDLVDDLVDDVTAVVAAPVPAPLPFLAPSRAPTTTRK